MVEVRLDYLSSNDEAAYRELVSTVSTSLFQHTLAYRDLLATTTECEPIYILARTNDRIVGALPLFLEQNSQLGNVLNSLPFFGSPGGMLVDESLDIVTQEAAQKALVTGLEQAMAKHNCVTATLLTSQIDPRNTEDGHPTYEQYLPYKYKEQRTAQIVDLQRVPNDVECVETPPATTPQSTVNAETIGEHLFMLFEKRCRRAIRKPYKQDLELETSTADFTPLFNMHKKGMENKDGRIKPPSFFEMIPDTVSAEQYDLLYTRKNGTIIAGLLLFYDGNTVEYYTPAYEFEHRDDQATSMLIFEAMKKAVSNNFRYWNFGGTLSSQGSLHRFKRGWGADDHPYHYYTVPGDDIETLLAATPEDIANSYDWSYVIPFDVLLE